MNWTGGRLSRHRRRGGIGGVGAVVQAQKQHFSKVRNNQSRQSTHRVSPGQATISRSKSSVVPPAWLRRDRRTTDTAQQLSQLNQRSIPSTAPSLRKSSFTSSRRESSPAFREVGPGGQESHLSGNKGSGPVSSQRRSRRQRLFEDVKPHPEISELIKPSLELQKGQILETSDWVGAAVLRPLRVQYPAISYRKDFAKRRRTDDGDPTQSFQNPDNTLQSRAKMHQSTIRGKSQPANIYRHRGRGSQQELGQLSRVMTPASDAEKFSLPYLERIRTSRGELHFNSEVPRSSQSDSRRTQPLDQSWHDISPHDPNLRKCLASVGLLPLRSQHSSPRGLKYEQRPTESVDSFYLAQASKTPEPDQNSLYGVSEMEYISTARHGPNSSASGPDPLYQHVLYGESSDKGSSRSYPRYSTMFPDSRTPELQRGLTDEDPPTPIGMDLPTEMSRSRSEETSFTGPEPRFHFLQDTSSEILPSDSTSMAGEDGRISFNVSAPNREDEQFWTNLIRPDSSRTWQRALHSDKEPSLNDLNDKWRDSEGRAMYLESTAYNESEPPQSSRQDPQTNFIAKQPIIATSSGDLNAIKEDDLVEKKAQIQSAESRIQTRENSPHQMINKDEQAWMQFVFPSGFDEPELTNTPPADHQATAENGSPSRISTLGAAQAQAGASVERYQSSAPGSQADLAHLPLKHQTAEVHPHSTQNPSSLTHLSPHPTDPSTAGTSMLTTPSPGKKSKFGRPPPFIGFSGWDRSAALRKSDESSGYRAVEIPRLPTGRQIASTALLREKLDRTSRDFASWNENMLLPQVSRDHTDELLDRIEDVED